MICGFVTDRGNEYSDEDEENEFSSTEDAYDGNDGIGLTGYEAGTSKQRQQESMLRKYRKLDRRDVSAEAAGGGGKGGGRSGGSGGAAVVDSDSEFENLKEKGSRAKISRVSESAGGRFCSGFER